MVIWEPYLTSKASMDPATSASSILPSGAYKMQTKHQRVSTRVTQALTIKTSLCRKTRRDVSGHKKSSRTIPRHLHKRARPHTEGTDRTSTHVNLVSNHFHCVLTALQGCSAPGLLPKTKHDFTFIKPLFSKGRKRRLSWWGNVISFPASPLFSPVSVQLNLLSGFSAVAVTLCPVARCLWAGVDVERISYQH